MILRVWEPTGFKCGSIQVLRWRHLGPVPHSIFPHPVPQRLCSLPGLPVATRPHIPPGSVQQKKKLSVGTLTKIPGLTWPGEAWATCLLLASACGREGIQEYLPVAGLGEACLPGAGSGFLWKQVIWEWGMKEWATARRQGEGTPGGQYTASVHSICGPLGCPLQAFVTHSCSSKV